MKGLEGLWVISFTFEEDEASYLADAALPNDWNRKPVPPDWHLTPPKATQRIGDEWIARKASLVLRVPSAIIPNDHNYLINPQHPLFDLERVAPAERFHFDDRLASLIKLLE